jgi:hypothetical protein
VTEDDKQRMVVSMALSGMLRDIPTHELVTTFVEKLGVTDAKNADSDIHSAYKIAESIAPDKRLDYMFNILFKCADNVSEDRVKAMLRLLKVDLKVFFNSKMLVDFLGQLTKSEIDLVAAEIGVKKAKGGEYAKIPAMKKDEMIAAITSIEGFVYDGKLPKVLKFS